MVGLLFVNAAVIANYTTQQRKVQLRLSIEVPIGTLNSALKQAGLKE